jgi:putative transposase
VILDIYSRGIVNWRIEDHESAELARELMDGAITKEGVDPNQLTIHADNGASMASHSVAEFLATLDFAETVSSHENSEFPSVWLGHET